MTVHRSNSQAESESILRGAGAVGLGPHRGGSAGRETLTLELGWGTGEVRATERPWGSAARCHGARWSARSGCLLGCKHFSRPGSLARAGPGPSSSAEPAFRFPVSGDPETPRLSQGLPPAPSVGLVRCYRFMLIYLPLEFRFPTCRVSAHPPRSWGQLPVEANRGRSAWQKHWSSMMSTRK